jgi:hypothetical protein
MAAFGRIQDSPTLAQNIVRYPTPVTQTAALEAVRRIQDQSALAYIAGYWGDVPYEVREEAIGKMNQADHLNMVTENFPGDDRIRQTVDKRLSQLQDEAPVSPPKPSGRERLSTEWTAPASRTEWPTAGSASAAEWTAPASRTEWPTAESASAAEWTQHFASQPTVTVRQWSATRKREETIEVTFDPDEEGVAVVQSESGKQYVVTRDGCECPQFEHRRAAGPCRHMQAVGEAVEQVGPEAVAWWHQQSWVWAAPETPDEAETLPPEMPTYARDVEPGSPAWAWLEQRRQEEADADLI